MNKEITKEEIESILKDIDSDFQWPIYDDFGFVTIKLKDEKGVEWVTIMSAESFHEQMKEAVKKNN